MSELSDKEKKSLIIKLAVSAVLLITMIVIGIVMLNK